MKKTNIYAAIAAVTMLSASGLASANSGTMSFAGTIDNNTCQVTGMDDTAVIPFISTADFQALSHDVIASQGTKTISVTNCPSSYTKAKLQFQFATEQNTAGRLDLGGTEMRGGWVYLHKNDDPATKNALTRTELVEIDLVNNAGSFTFYPTLRRSHRGGDVSAVNVVPGSYSAPISLTMTYE